MVEKPKHKQKHRPRRKLEYFVIATLIFGIVVVFIFAGWAIINVFGGHVERKYQGEHARVNAEKQLRIVFPEEATNFYLDYYKLLDWNTHIRFEIPSDLGTDWLIEDICGDRLVHYPDRDAVWPDDELDWWHPEQAVDYIVASCPVSPSAFFSYYIMFDQTDPETWVVYISANSARD